MKISEPKTDVLKLPLEARAEMALKAAVDKVIEEHARPGLPLHLLAQWQAHGNVC